MHRDLSSCQKSENFNEPIFWESSAHTDAQTHAQGSIYRTLPPKEVGPKISPYMSPNLYQLITKKSDEENEE